MDASLRSFVVERSAGHCEYCQIPQRFFTELFQIEHIVARQHRGLTVKSNLAIACSRCNLHKGPNLAGIDPLSNVLFDYSIQESMIGLNIFKRYTAARLSGSQRSVARLRMFLI